MSSSVLLTGTALVALELCLFSITPAFAQDDAPAPERENIVVTATRIPTPESQVASSITVVTAADIVLKQEQTLPDVLKDVPGLNIVQTGGPGGQTSVFMRGTNSNHVKVFVDGIDVSDPSNPNASFDFAQFLTPDIERLEVLRGPQSGLYGSDAIGGVINIITKSGEGPTHFNAGIEGGSFGTFNQSAGVAGSTGPFHYSTNIEHFRSDDTPVTPLNLLAPGEKRIDDNYDNVTASTKLGLDVTDNFDLGLVGRYSNTHLGTTGDNFATFPAFPDSAQSQSATLQYYTRGTGHLSLMDGFLEQTLGVAYSSISSSDFSPDGPFTSYYSGDRLKVDWQGKLHFSDAEILIFGAEHEHDEIRLPISAGTSIESGYADLQSNLFENFYDTVSLRLDSNDRFGDKFTYRIAPTYLIPATGTKLKGSVGTGFKAPTLSEMFQNFPSSNFFGNPNLKPESSLGYDFGFEQSVLEDKVQFGATYYHNDITNLITNNATFTSYANVGKATTYGIEAFLSYRPIDPVTLRLDYTYTRAKDDIAHQDLLRRPKNKVNFDARWQATEALSFDANLLYLGSWADGNRDFSIPYLDAPGYVTVDIAANYDVTEQLTVCTRITNLAGENYQDPTGFLRPGRGFFGGIKTKF
jgi:vitamin B12 transporter